MNQPLHHSFPPESPSAHSPGRGAASNNGPLPPGPAGFAPAGWWPLFLWAGDLHTGSDQTGFEELREELNRLAASGFDAVTLPALREGVPYYASGACRERGRLTQLPWMRRWRRKPAPFPIALEIASQAGLRVWGEMDLLLGGRADFPGPSLATARPRWTARNALGRPSPIAGDHERYFLCPSNPDVLRLYSEAAVEIAVQSPLSALILNTRDWPDEQFDGPESHCMCFHCQSRAMRDLELDLQEVLEEGAPAVREEWRRWRRRILTQFVQHLRARVWSVRPSLPIFLRMQWKPPVQGEEGEIAGGADENSFTRRIEWRSWAAEGLVDGLLLEVSPGSLGEWERPILESKEIAQLNCPVWPLFPETPVLAHPGAWPRAARQSLAGWGWTRHLVEAAAISAEARASMAAPLFPRHPAPETILKSEEPSASRYPAPECRPIPAAIQIIAWVEQLLIDLPLRADLVEMRNQLVRCGGDLELNAIENLLFQLDTLAAVLAQEAELGKEELLHAGGLLRLAANLLRFHSNLYCQELYLYDAG